MKVRDQVVHHVEAVARVDEDIRPAVPALFRDLAAPFGVAVFVPLFPNQITGLIAGGATGADAAIRSIHLLAIAELICIAAGIAAVLFLPKIRSKGASK